MSPGEMGQTRGGDEISSAEIWYNPGSHEETHTQTHKLTCTHCATPPQPQSAMAKPHVSVGINRSALSSRHPAFKSFLEVVLLKPSAEEDKRTAIPQAQCLLNPTHFCLCCALFLLHSSLIPTFLQFLIISIPLLFLRISCFLVHSLFLPFICYFCVSLSFSPAVFCMCHSWFLPSP